MTDYKCRFKDHWNEYTETQLQIIHNERQENKKKFKREQNAEYGYMCRACEKPNRLGAHHCTRCYFDHDEWDIVKLPSNIFLDIIEGRETGTKTLQRDDLILIFDDKFPISDNHIDVIPVEVICDITELDSSHITLVEHMLAMGVEHMKSRNIKQFDGYKIEEIMACGFNYPVSVKHLHLHIMLPCFTHRNSFKTSRWHSIHKVLSDLKEFGKVHLYKDFPNDEEVLQVHLNAYKWHDHFESKKV